MKTLTPPKLFLQNTSCTEVRRVFFEKQESFGYGVFALRDIEQSELIEEATYFITGFVEQDEESKNLKTFCWPEKCNCESCKKKPDAPKQLVASTGNTMLYNHSEEPNAIISMLRDQRIMKIYASKEIKKDEQIFLNYGPYYNAWTKQPH